MCECFVGGIKKVKVVQRSDFDSGNDTPKEKGFVSEKSSLKCGCKVKCKKCKCFPVQ